jgi:putative NIF3 family GTP cyclohydrolase 1 type 2
MAIYAAHTNLDAVAGGVNDILCRGNGTRGHRAVPGDACGLGYAGNRKGRPPGNALNPCRFLPTASGPLSGSRRARRRRSHYTGAAIRGVFGKRIGIDHRFLRSGADVYVSGDMKYHDAMAIADAGCGVVDVGHFSSEHLAVPVLAEKSQPGSPRRNMPPRSSSVPGRRTLSGNCSILNREKTGL